MSRSAPLTPLIGTPPRQLPPPGLRPPPRPWLQLVVRLLLLCCLLLLFIRGALLRWATAQPSACHNHVSQGVGTMLAVPPPSQPPCSLNRLGGWLITTTLQPPGLTLVEGLLLTGLGGIALELLLAALLLVFQTRHPLRAGRLVVRIRIPHRERTAQSGVDLFRALHHQDVAAGLWPGQGPWLSLTLSARPDEPVDMGFVLAGGTVTQRRKWAAAIRKTVQGLVPDTLVEFTTDQLEAVLKPGCALCWREWVPTLPPTYPLRLHDDREASDLIGPLAAALQPRQGVLLTELQLSLRPRPRDTDLTRGWRGAGLRRLLRLNAKQEHALAPDAAALETKLAAPVYAATLRAVAVAQDRSRVPEARAELDELQAVLGQYAARSGSRLQRWIGQAHGRVLPPTWRDALFPLGVGLLAALSLALPAVPAPLSLILLLLSGLATLQRLLGHQYRQALRRIVARPLRASPPPSLIWGEAWRGPAILCAEELAALWHLPTLEQGRLIRRLSCRYLPPPPHAFCPMDGRVLPSVPSLRPPDRLVIGYGRHQGGDEAPVGIPLRDARQGLAFTAPPGVGKTQLAANLADQLRPCGYTLIDGKGDDSGNLVEVVRRRIPLADESRLIVLDLLDEWPIGLNPLAEVNLADPAGIDQILGQIEAIFARLDPETWSRAPRMKGYLRKATLLVLEGEPYPTLAHVKQALLDAAYRERLLRSCRNVEVRDFWVVEFPRMGEQQQSSRDALISRFDMLLDSTLTRYLFNQVKPALSFHEAIAERLLVLVPLPHRSLGALAGPVGMLLFQSLMRAAFARPGSDLTRPEYGFIGDEFQVVIEHCDSRDVRDLLTQVRSFGIITIIANQLQRQLGDLADYALTAIANRILLRTQEPDATLYARHYADSGVTAGDVSGQEPRDHQYASIGVNGKPTGLFSLRPLPWPNPLAIVVPPETGPHWQSLVPPTSPTPAFDRAICRLVYASYHHREALAEALASCDDERWTSLLERWDAIRAHQRSYLLAHPGAIPETTVRQRWLTRLRAARPRILAMAEYARIRRTITPRSNHS